MEEWRSAVIAAESCGVKPSPAEIPGPLVCPRMLGKTGTPDAEVQLSFHLCRFHPSLLPHERSQSRAPLCIDSRLEEYIRIKYTNCIYKKMLYYSLGTEKVLR